jgi:predicted DNA-binding WGR domain protein
MNNIFNLRQTEESHNNKIAIFDCNQQFIGLLIASFPEESAHALAYDYGQVYQRSSFTNIDDFPSLKESKYFAIEYVSSQEQELFNQLLIKNPEIEQIKNKASKKPKPEFSKVYLENKENGQMFNYFYEITLDECCLIIRSGQINSPGIHRTIQYSQKEKAQQEFQKKIDQKIKQGFIICH